MLNNSPLRYPGGKSRVSGFVAQLIRNNNIVKGNYVEPFAGGAGVALNLLLMQQSIIYILMIRIVLYMHFGLLLLKIQNNL